MCARSTSASLRARSRRSRTGNALDPQPDFVLFGGDLAQTGRPDELEQDKGVLSGLKAPVEMMAGEHDWFYDMGEKWQGCSGRPTTHSIGRAFT